MVESLWVRGRGKANKVDIIMVRGNDRPPHQMGDQAQSASVHERQVLLG